MRTGGHTDAERSPDAVVETALHRLGLYACGFEGFEDAGRDGEGAAVGELGFVVVGWEAIEAVYWCHEPMVLLFVFVFFLFLSSFDFAALSAILLAFFHIFKMQGDRDLAIRGVIAKITGIIADTYS
jgi:hypothetical protein